MCYNVIQCIAIQCDAMIWSVPDGMHCNTPAGCECNAPGQPRRSFPCVCLPGKVRSFYATQCSFLLPRKLFPLHTFVSSLNAICVAESHNTVCVEILFWKIPPLEYLGQKSCNLQACSPKHLTKAEVEIPLLFQLSEKHRDRLRCCGL